MLTPSVAVLAIGTFMVPGGVLTPAPNSVSVAVIAAGSMLVVVGATLGFAPIQWTELAIGGLKGTVQTRDQEFKDFYREHRERLQRFATLMCGDRREASELVREASARTRLAWTTGASADPLLATLRTLMHWLEQPGVWLLFIGGRSRSRWHRDRLGADDGADQQPIVESLAQLAPDQRAALLLDSLLGLSVPTIAELVGHPEAQVRRDIDAALQHIGPQLQSRPGAVRDHRR